MKRNSETFKFLLIGFLALVIAHLSRLFLPPKVSWGINDLSSWYLYSFSRKATRHLKFVGIAVDEESLNKIQQRWPWKRSVYAQLIKVLNQERVAAIGFDYAFVGESEDKEDDRVFREAFSNSSSRIVLAYIFDFQKGAPVFPLSELRELAYSTGMLNTPQDADGQIRRLRGFVRADNDVYYSFSLALCAAYLNKKPEDLLHLLPLGKDGTYPVNYLLKDQDLISLSFYEALQGLAGAKQKFGNDFLQGALVLIYPKAQIFHDTYHTPVGNISGGIVHLNGVADILTRRFVVENNSLRLPFLLLSFVLVYYALNYFGFFSGVLSVLGVLILDFWGLVILGLKGIRFDYSHVAIFVLVYFVLGSLYKYIYFLTAMLRIKDKATLDPLRNLFTLRYFYYRLALETQKIYLGRDLFLLFAYLESFRDASEGVPLDKIKSFWKDASALLGCRGKLWSVYSQDEIVGCLVSSPSNIAAVVNLLKNGLAKLLQKDGFNCRLKLGYVKLKRNYPARELLFMLSAELRNRNQEVVAFEDKELGDLLEISATKAVQTDKLLDSLSEDIEEKNRQLLSLIENLEKEHAKTKEAFFQIITSLVNALEARDAYTEGHSERVSYFALKIADRLGWSAGQKDLLKKAALLHDLGKIGIPDSILHKKGSLSEEEFEQIRKHEVIGVKILQPLKELSEILPWILYHHERWDGKGYPRGLAGDAIPEAAQIISLADVFDALTTGRDYKAAFSWDEALKEISNNKGTQFNPRLADIFIEIISTLPKKA